MSSIFVHVSPRGSPCQSIHHAPSPPNPSHLPVGPNIFLYTKIIQFLKLNIRIFSKFKLPEVITFSFELRFYPFFFLNYSKSELYLLVQFVIFLCYLVRLFFCLFISRLRLCRRWSRGAVHYRRRDARTILEARQVHSLNILDPVYKTFYFEYMHYFIYKLSMGSVTYLLLYPAFDNYWAF